MKQNKNKTEQEAFEVQQFLFFAFNLLWDELKHGFQKVLEKWLYLHSCLKVKYSVRCLHSWFPRSRNNVLGWLIFKLHKYSTHYKTNTRIKFLFLITITHKDNLYKFKWLAVMAYLIAIPKTKREESVFWVWLAAVALEFFLFVCFCFGLTVWHAGSLFQTRDWVQPPEVEAQSANHWTTKECPILKFERTWEEASQKPLLIFCSHVLSKYLDLYDKATHIHSLVLKLVFYLVEKH